MNHQQPMSPQTRPTVRGKFLSVDGRRFLVKGATYGTFAPDSSGRQFPGADRVADDFAQMARHGINTVRTYTLPPSPSSTKPRDTACM